MKAVNSTRVLSQDEMASIHQACCSILEKIGVKVDNAELLQELGRMGYTINNTSGTVHFPQAMVEEFLSRYGGRERKIDELTFNAGGCVARFIDPADGKIKFHTLETASDMARLADGLENITSLNPIGDPSDVPASMRCFYEKFISLTTTTKPFLAGGITDLSEMPRYLKLCSTYCEGTDKDLYDVAYNIMQKSYPLYIDESKGELLLQFKKRGLRADIESGIPSIGGTAPVTLAGSLAIALADQISCLMINRSFYPDDPYSLITRKLLPEDNTDYTLHFHFNLGLMDMKSALNCTSTTEAYLANMALSDMARYYGAYTYTGAFCKTQAKTIASVQSGAERFGDMLTGLLAGSTGFGSLGVISEPEGINSPTQLVIDDEMAGMARRIHRGFEVNQDTLALDAIEEEGHKAFFMNHPHTAEYFRTEIRRPGIFLGGQGYEDWLQSGAKTEVELAREKALSILENHHPQVVSDSLKEKMLQAITSA